MKSRQSKLARDKDYTHLVEIATATLTPLENWSKKCHAASLTLVRAGIGTRVARGACVGVVSQHSWVIVGEDCYSKDAVIVDPTLWSYSNKVARIWVGTYKDGLHHPHGKGSIWNYGRPPEAAGPVIELSPKTPWSLGAARFLELLGPLDKHGWHVLANSPVEGWPAAEILPVINEQFPCSVPIDIIGMLTSLNPSGLYW